MDFLSHEQLIVLPTRLETSATTGLGDFTVIEQTGLGLINFNVAVPTDVNTATAVDVGVGVDICILSICD